MSSAHSGASPAHDEEARGRRSFLTKIIAAGSLLWAAAAAYPLFRFLNAPETADETVSEVELGDPAQFAPGTITKFAFGKKPGYIVAGPDGDIHALSAVCTHLGCVIQAAPENDGFVCACHGGRYDLWGKNIAGPPPLPLEKYKTEIRDNSLWVMRG